MTTTLAGVLIYLLIQIGIATWVSRKVKTETDYLLAGRSLGYGLATFTIFASWFGAETCIGAAGIIYASGLSGASADPFGYGGCLILLGVVFAAPLWRRKLVTLADLFRERYGEDVERFAVILMIPTSVLWAAAQIRAFGQVLVTISAIELDTGIACAAVAVVLYTIRGGLLSDAYTDAVQACVLILGLLVLLFSVVPEIGGFGAAWAAIPSERLQLASPETPWLVTAEAWAIPIIGSVVAQEMISRVSASRSQAVARRSVLMASAVYLTVGLIPVFLGLVGAQLLATPLEDPEQLLPTLATRYLSPLGFIVFAGALVSAILSTVDSMLLSAGSLTSHNVVSRLIPTLDDRGKLRAARAGVMGAGVVAYVLALRGESVLELVEAASSFGSAGVFVLMTFALFSKVGGRWSAHAALALGTGVYLVGAGLDWPAPYLLALVSALAGYLLLARARLTSG